MGNKAFNMELFFAALADRTRPRPRLINLMAPNEICGCFLVEKLAERRSKVSRYLAYLRSGAGRGPPRRQVDALQAG